MGESRIVVMAGSGYLVFSLLEFSALLLLMSGDVESNPGPGTLTPEYETMKECTQHFTLIFKEDLLSVSDLMFQNDLIGGQLREDLSATHITKHKRATDLFDHLLDLVKLNETFFSKCMAVLPDLGPWTSGILEPINAIYSRRKAAQATQQQHHLSRAAPPTDHESRINHIATQVGIDPSLLDHPCGDQHIQKISFKIVHWNSYARYLGLDDQEESSIRTDISLAAPNDRPHKMLRIWQEKFHFEIKGRYRYLLRGILDIEGNAKLVGDICMIIRDNPAGFQGGSQQPSGEAQHSSCEQPASMVVTGSPLPTHPEPHQEPEKKPIQEQEDDKPKLVCVSVPVEKSMGKQLSHQESIDSDVAHAQVATDRLWPKNQDVLGVYFLNPQQLQSLGLNEMNVISWANVWESPTSHGIVPVFRLTQDRNRAKIRVKISPLSGSWSKVGTDAESVMDPRKPTMTLGLLRGNSDYNQHTTIHEFGHALGMEHEHQRSKFWRIAEKFLDTQAMMDDPALSGTDIQEDFLAASQHGAGSANYDPESIMHYWFDIQWLKDKRHRNPSKVLKSSKLKQEEKDVIIGIHKRHHKLAERPSPTDYAFLEQCYQNRAPPERKTVHNTSFASGQAPPDTTGQVEKDAAMREDDSASDPDNDPEPKSEEPSFSQPAQSISHNLKGANKGLLVYPNARNVPHQYLQQEQRYKKESASVPKSHEHAQVFTESPAYSQPTSCVASVPVDDDQAQLNPGGPDVAVNSQCQPSSTLLGQPSDQSEVEESKIPVTPFQASSDDIERDVSAMHLGDQPSTSLSQLIEELSIIAQEAQEEEVVQELQQLRYHWESNVIKIGVIGATNSGKSTTINAILHGKYLPASSGGTTARVVCIRSDPAAIECKLSDSNQEPLAVGKDEIHKKLERLNSEQRAAGEDAVCQSLLHICVSRPLNIQAEPGCYIELFDTPGMSEAREAAIYKDAKKALDRMDGIVVVLSEDTAVLRETTQLIQSLRKYYPGLLDATAHKRAIILMNKCDLLFEEDEGGVIEKKKEISVKLNLPVKDTLYYSAKMGLESRHCKSNHSSVERKQFKKLVNYVEDIKEFSEQVEKYSSLSLDNVVKVAEMVEQASNIKVVEERLNSLLPGLKDNKLVASLKIIADKLLSHQNLSQKVCELQYILNLFSTCN